MDIGKWGIFKTFFSPQKGKSVAKPGIPVSPLNTRVPLLANITYLLKSFKSKFIIFV